MLGGTVQAVAGVGDAVGVAVGVALGVDVGVAVGVGVGTAVGVAVGVGVGTAVGVAVGVEVGVAVGVAVGSRIIATLKPARLLSEDGLALSWLDAAREPEPMSQFPPRSPRSKPMMVSFHSRTFPP